MLTQTMKKHFPAVLLLLLPVILWIFIGNRKIDFNCDEYFSYMGANTHTTNFFDIENGDIRSGDYFREKYTLAKEDRFHYQLAYKNQAEDIHPPLFYMAFHTISSFFPGVFTKWTALATNFIFLFLCETGIYFFLMTITKSRRISILGALGYGINFGAINSAMLIRMYVLLGAACMCYAAVLAKEVCHKEELPARTGTGFLAVIREEKGFLFKVCFALMAGALSHYYFFVFAFLASAAYGIYLMVKKYWMSLAAFVSAAAVTAVCYLLLWPYALFHIFKDFRGEENFQNAFDLSDLAASMKTLWTLLNEQVFGGGFLLLALLLLILFLLCCKTAKKACLTKELCLCLTMLFICLCYFVIVGKVAPFKTDRYIMCIYPVLFAALAGILGHLLKNLKGNTLAAAGIGLTALLCTLSAFQKPVPYCYQDRAELLQTVSKEPVKDCIYITYVVEWWKVSGSSMDLMHYDNIYFTRDIKKNRLDSPYIEQLQEAMLYVDNNYSEESIREYLGQYLWDGAFTMEYQYTSSSSNVYRLTRL